VLRDIKPGEELALLYDINEGYHYQRRWERFKWVFFDKDYDCALCRLGPSPLISNLPFGAETLARFDLSVFVHPLPAQLQSILAIVSTMRKKRTEQGNYVVRRLLTQAAGLYITLP